MRWRGYMCVLESVWMTLDTAGVVYAQSAGSDASLRDVALPNGWTATIYVDDKPTEFVSIDPQGHSAYYRVEMRSDDDTQEMVAWQTCGLTGWVMKVVAPR